MVDPEFDEKGAVDYIKANSEYFFNEFGKQKRGPGPPPKSDTVISKPIPCKFAKDFFVKS